MAERTPPETAESTAPGLCGLFQAFRRLDERLEQAMTAAEKAFSAPPGSDSYRGLYITREDANRLLGQEPGALAWPGVTDSEQENGTRTEDEGRLSWLRRVFDLSPFDIDTVVIALAPEVDLRYERLYAYLQDDVTRRRPTADLVLNLLCRSSEEKLQRRAHFAPNAPLIRNGLILLVQDPHHVQPPLLSHYLKLDEQIVGFLLGQKSLDARVLPFCQLTRPTVSYEEVGLSAESKLALRKLAAQARKRQRPLRLYFQGNNASEKESAAGALAGGLRMRLLQVDLNELVAQSSEYRNLLSLVVREARFQDAVLYLEGVDTLREEHPGFYKELVSAAAADHGISVLSGAKSGHPFPANLTEVIEIAFPFGDFQQRASSWHRELAKRDFSFDEREVHELASRFRLRSDQIVGAVAGARSISMWRAAKKDGSGHDPKKDPDLQDLYAAARAQCGRTLTTLARKVEPLYTWEDIVLPPDALSHFREICQRVIHRQRVFGDWGFDGKLSLGKGVNALFSGPSGTGKTMAAEIIAHELLLDLYKIDLSAVVSKWIGETEKNLDRIFTAAENSNAILFFDEADALFGKRSEVRDSHDRYANLEISYLLQKMEEYEGVAILATNMRAHLDDAFVRRLAFIVHFPFPDEQSRHRIWANVWPNKIPLGDDLDFDFLARQFKMSGGVIKNIALTAAFLAAEEGAAVAMRHLIQATRREFQKQGKNLSETEINETATHFVGGRP